MSISFCIMMLPPPSSFSMWGSEADCYMHREPVYAFHVPMEFIFSFLQVYPAALCSCSALFWLVCNGTLSNGSNLVLNTDIREALMYRWGHQFTSKTQYLRCRAKRSRDLPVSRPLYSLIEKWFWVKMQVFLCISCFTQYPMLIAQEPKKPRKFWPRLVC